MYQYTIPCTNKKLTIITIGNYINPPTHHEMGIVSSWIEKNKINFPENINQLKSLVPKEINFEIFDSKTTNKEYVLLIESDSKISPTDLHNYQQVSKMVMEDEDDDIFLFVYGTLKMSRINKDLINFL